MEPLKKGKLYLITLFLAIVVVSFLSFYGCGGGVSDDSVSPIISQGYITGYVTAGTTINSIRDIDPAIMAQTSGIANAEVWLESDRSKKTKTNASGAFTITPVNFGYHRVIASYTSPSGKVYKWRSGWVSVTKSQPAGSSGNIPIILATGTISGTLINKDGQPIANAQITLWGETVTTNSSGYFNWIYPMPPISEELTVKATGYQPATISANFSIPAPVVQITLPTLGSTNRPPTLVITADKYSGVSNSEYVNINAQASDPDGDTLEYYWSASPGSIATLTTNSSARWIAPTSGSGIATITCIVVDTASLSAKVQISISYGAGGSSTNLPPTTPQITAPTTALIGSTINLSAVATDPEGLPLSYSWSQISGIAGSFINTGLPNTSWIAPSSPTTAVLAVAVSDGTNITTGTVSIAILVSGATASITKPLIPYALYNSNEDIYLEGFAKDSSGNNISVSIAKPLWSYSYNGGPYYDFASNSFGTYFPKYKTPGTYTIQLRVSDVTGNHSYATLPIRINDFPVLQITSPAPFSVHLASTTISFTGSVIRDEDLSDGVISPASYSWYANSTLLANAPATNTILPPGTHTITLKYTDCKNLTGSTSIQINVNAPPLVEIASPALPDQLYPYGSPLTIVASATDPETGKVADGYYSWWDNDVAISGANTATVTRTFTPGSHTIRVRVVDPNPFLDPSVAYKEATTTFRINTIPVMYITSPAPNSAYIPGEPISISGYGWDEDENAVVATSTLTWKYDSSIINTATSSFSYSPSAVLGTHTITLEGKDTYGTLGSTSVQIFINASPTVSILSPASGTRFDTGTPITFVATAADSYDTTPTLLWYCDSTLIGQGIGLYNVATAPASGPHIITCYASDSHGLYASYSIAIYVNTLPTATIVISEPQYATAPDNIPIYLATSSSVLHFSAITYDQELGGALPDNSIGWYRNTGSGWTFLGSGTNFSATFNPGSSTLKVILQDSHFSINPTYGSNTAELALRLWQSIQVAALTKPLSIDSDGSYYYVIASADRRIEKYSYTGITFNEIASYGSSATFTSIVSLAVKGSNLYVLDRDQSAIYSMTTNPIGGSIASITTSGLLFPSWLTYNGIYYFVSDTGNNRVLAINPTTGNIDNTYTSGGLPSMAYSTPAGLRFINNQFFLADYGNNRVIRFNSTSGLNNEAAQYNATGPADMAVVGTRYIITCSYSTGEVSVFNYNSPGSLVTTFGSSGTELGQLSSPTSIYFANGDIFITEVGTNRIQVFKTGSAELFYP